MQGQRQANFGQQDLLGERLPDVGTWRGIQAQQAARGAGIQRLADHGQSAIPDRYRQGDHG